MHVVELEEKLTADSSGALRDELLAGLAADRAAVRKLIDAGLPPDAFRTAQGYHDACAAAERVVIDYWTRAHASVRRGEMPPI